MNREYTRNHYVPVWYQKGFISPASQDKELYCLDLRPPSFCDGRGKIRFRKAVQRLGPKKCFFQDDLYTAMLGGRRSTEIEEVFFGEIDSRGKKAVDHFNNFSHDLSGTHDAFQDLMLYMSTQKMRTPKGLGWLRQQVGATEKLFLLMQLMEYKTLFCAIWTECVWQIADASQSPTKFIVSDHPVTIYNRDCRPLSLQCRHFNDPDIRMNASHTLFPLSSEKILILTNLSWARNPYQTGTKLRPNPNFNRDTIFFLHGIQVGRQLSETEVRQINFITKRRSFRFIAAGEPEWLYPEKYISVSNWNSYGYGYLCMPDPRSMSLTSGIMMGLKGGGVDSFDAYGRKPWQAGYNFDVIPAETETFHKFTGEFARLHGPRRRGRSFEFGSLGSEEDSDDYHAYNLSLERRRRK